MLPKLQKHTESIKFHLSIISLFILSVLLFYLPAKGFWGVDNADKYLIAESIVKNDFKSATINWKGAEIWDNKEINPLQPPFSAIHKDKIVSMFPPFFSFLTALIIKLTGSWGLYLFGITGTLLILYNAKRIAGLLNTTSSANISSVWITFLATPVLFYTFTYWEHTLVTGFCLQAIYRYLLFTKNPGTRNFTIFVIASVAPIYIRDVAVIFTISLYIVMLWNNRNRELFRTALKTGVLTTLLLTPLFLANYILIGDPLGPHMLFHIKTSNSLMQHITDRVEVFYYLFAASFGNITAAVSYILINAAAIISINRLKDRKKRVRAISLYLFILTFLSIVVLFEFILDLSNPLYSNSIMGVTPFLFAGFFKYEKSNRILSTLKKLIIVYPLIYALTAPVTGIAGFHWGCRYLLTLYPILVVISAGLMNQLSDIKLKRAFSAAVIASVLIQSYSLVMLNNHKTFIMELNDFVKNRPEEVVIVMKRYVGNHFPDSFFDKFYFNITQKKQLKHFRELLRKIKNTGRNRVLIVTGQEMFKKKRPLLKVDTRQNSINYNFKILSFEITDNYNLR